jgi:hypothetical protein
MFNVRDSQGVLRPFSFRDYNKYPIGKDDSSLRHLWYSEKMAEKCETIAIYRLADFSINVDVTAASETTNHGCLWDDMVYLGVGWYVSSKVNPSTFDSSYRMINPCKEVKLDAYSPTLMAEIQAELARVEAAGEPPAMITIDSYSTPSSVVEANRQAFNLAAYGNSYQQTRRALGDNGGHSGVDAPDPIEPEGHPDNPVFTGDALIYRALHDPQME